jgi:hypothetical protein
MAAWGGRQLAPPASAFPEALAPTELMAALSPADAAYMSVVVGGRSPCRWQLLDADRAVVVQWNITSDDEDGPRCFFHLTMPGVRYVSWHDHGFDNTSVVISGGYDELWRPSYWCSDEPIARRFRKGDMIFRNA